MYWWWWAPINGNEPCAYLSQFCWVPYETVLNMTDKFFNISSFFILPYREFDSLSRLSEEARAKYFAQRWVEFGLKNVQLVNYTVLVSSPGSLPNTITDMENKQCFLPSGASCNTKTYISINESFAFAAYSSVGSLEVRKKKTIITCLLLIKTKVIAKSHSRASNISCRISVL